MLLLLQRVFTKMQNDGENDDIDSDSARETRTLRTFVMGAYT